MASNAPNNAPEDENASSPSSMELGSFSSLESEGSPEIVAEKEFARDVVTAVYELGRIANAMFHPNENAKDSFRFIEKHYQYVREFLAENGENLKKLVEESKKEKEDWRFEEDNYLVCKQKVIEEFKTEYYAEECFVRLCAGLAFVAMGNRDPEKDHPITIKYDARNELERCIKELLVPGGTLQDSKWTEL